jgi:hypothetical protein
MAFSIEESHAVNTVLDFAFNRARLGASVPDGAAAEAAASRLAQKASVKLFDGIAVDVATLVAFVLQRDELGGRVPDEDVAREAAELLSARSARTLMAGIGPGDVRSAWPDLLQVAMSQHPEELAGLWQVWVDGALEGGGRPLALREAVEAFVHWVRVTPASGGEPRVELRAYVEPEPEPDPVAELAAAVAVVRERGEPEIPAIGTHVRVVREGTWYWQCPRYECGGHGSVPELDDEPVVCLFNATEESGECGQKIPRSAFKQGPPYQHEGWVMELSPMYGRTHVSVRLARTADLVDEPGMGDSLMWRGIRLVTVLS